VHQNRLFYLEYRLSEIEMFGPKGERVMTVKEIADATGSGRQTVLDAINRVFPDKMQKGKTTLLTEHEVAEISAELKRAHNIPGTREVPFTDYEMLQQTFRSLSWLKEKWEGAEAELAVARPKAIAFDSFIRSDKQMSIRDAGKHFSFTQSETFAILRSHGYLTEKDLPTSRAVNEDILTIREVQIGTKRDGSPRFRSQSVVESSQLENFRLVLSKFGDK
jgi:phage antirepressor YoqD-like protein